MCTTGVLRLGPNDYLLFKNKDFGRGHFDDRVVLDRDVFGVEPTRFADAADCFAAQKGASVAQVKLLRRRLERLVERTLTSISSRSGSTRRDIRRRSIL